MSQPTDTITKIPVGVERVLVAAARDEQFRNRLLQDRQAAIAELGPVLRPSELAILLSITAEQLVQAIVIMGSFPDDPEKLTFLTAMAESISDISAKQQVEGRSPAVTTENPSVPPAEEPPGIPAPDLEMNVGGIRPDK